MSDFNRMLAKAKAAWSIRSWIIYPDNEDTPIGPDHLIKLADELDAHGVDGGAKAWPDALRYIASAWTAAVEARLHELHRCPQCFSREIMIAVDVPCHIVADTSGARHFDRAVPIDEPELYWDDDTIAHCQACGHKDRIKRFHPVIAAADLQRMEAIHDTA